MIELDLVDFCRQFATQIIRANKTFGAFLTLVQQSMEKDKPHYENSEMSFEEKED